VVDVTIRHFGSSHGNVAQCLRATKDFNSAVQGSDAVEHF